MVTVIRQNVTSKIINVLNKYSLVDSNDCDLVSKINYFINTTKINKDLKKYGTVFLDLQDLISHKIIDDSKLSSEQRKEIESLQDDTIKQVKFVKDYRLEVQLNDEYFAKNVLLSIFNEASNYGLNLRYNEIYPKQIGSNKNEFKWLRKQTDMRTLVEFSSPNIAKPLHAGHMRSTFLGNYLSNLHKKFGHSVTRINYLGDWGTQYGKLAVGFSKYGSYDELNKKPMRHLLDVYIKANENKEIENEAQNYFSQMESDNAEFIKTWNLFRDLSIKELQQSYKSLNIEFDSYEAESQYYKHAKDVVEKLTQTNICKKLDDNAYQVSFKNGQNKQVEYILLKSNGSTVYITRDIAALLKRKREYNFDKIIYVVDSGQSVHFNNLYDTIKHIEPQCLGDMSFEEFYVPFGKMTNMSTRKGKIELLSDLINEAKNAALGAMKDVQIKKAVDDVDFVAATIGMSHLIIGDFIRLRMKDYEFSWANMLSSDSSAYSMHYVHARLSSLIERAKKEMNIKELNVSNINYKLLNTPVEQTLIHHLARYDDTLWMSFTKYEPCVLVQYLFQLVRFTNLALRGNYVVDTERSVAEARLLLYYCCKQVLADSLQTLGITALNKM